MPARYRDKQTGKLVSASTWKRSKAQGGTRFVRERAKPTAQRKRRVKLPVPPLIKPKRAKRPKKLKKGELPTEYVLKFKYTSLHHGINVEVHLFGPGGATRDQVKAIYEQWFTTGETPDGWQVDAINWRNSTARGTQQTEQARQDLWFVLSTRPSL